jgi:glycosyltransferase involved in cell wall biosynthesis
MIRICTSLARAGYNVELVGRKKPDSLPLPPQSFTQTRLNCFFQKGKFFYIEYNLRLFFFLLFRRRYDLLYSVDLDTLLPATFLHYLKRKPFLLDAHEYFTETPEVERRPGVKRIWEWVARLGIPRMKAGITVCESLAELFEQRYERKFSVVRNVPFRKAFPGKEGKEEPAVILYQGYLNEGRGLESAIRAMQQIPDAQLWLAGEGDLSESLRELAKEQGVDQRVRFLGFVKPDDLARITPRATLGLNLLEARSKSYYYSLANKAFDYMQAGLPAIHMDFPEYRKINEQFEVAILLKKLDEEELTKEIEGLLSDTARYQNMVEECRKAAEVFIWEKEKKELLKIIHSCLDKPLS